MKHALIAILLGLGGGVLGALGAQELWPPSGEGTAAGPDLAAERSLTDRMARLESALEARGLLQARLEGRVGESEAETGLTPAAKAALLAEFEQELVERLEPVVRKQVESTVEEIAAREEADEVKMLGRGKQRMALADVAREVGLSAGEEDDLRRIYEDTQNKFLEIMARPDGDIEQVKRDIEAAKNDETAAPQLIGKYLPKMLGNIGELMTVRTEQQTRVVETVGPDKAKELEGYDIVEANPLGIGGEMSIGARMGR